MNEIIELFGSVNFWFGLTVGALASDIVKKIVKQKLNKATGNDGKGE